jgi:hypothetical protein
MFLLYARSEKMVKREPKKNLKAQSWLNHWFAFQNDDFETSIQNSKIDSHL